MKLLSARTRLTIGLTCLLVSVLAAAMLLGIVPDRRASVVRGRKDLCEAIGVASSDYIGAGQISRLQFLLRSLVDRNESVLSAGVRRADGTLVGQVGAHELLWTDFLRDESSETHVRIPIRTRDTRWGQVELCFLPVERRGWFGIIGSPWVQLMLFVGGMAYLMFYVYLGRMLHHLDPSKAVPKRVRAALDSLAGGLLVMDRQERVVLANEAFSRWVGRPPEKLVGIKASQFNWQPEEEAGVLPQPWTDALLLGQPQAGVLIRLVSDGGSSRVLLANASPVLGGDGKYSGVLVSLDDVTQLEETKADLSQAKQAAEEANRAKSEFLARMSHEIRTPMNSILGYTDVLRNGFDVHENDRQDYLSTIHASGEHLLALINDILDLSKIESGHMELELSRCSPLSIIGQVLSLLHGEAQDKGIALNFKCKTPIPETILTDSVRMRQVLMNLAGNAIKFTADGGVRLIARMTDDQPPQLAIDVVDTGIGIAEESLESIFSPFSQADNSITRRYGGTGLGLAVSRQLAKALGGDVSVVSQLGTGSVFTVKFDTGPLEGVNFVETQSPQPGDGQKQRRSGRNVRLDGVRILVADDVKPNRKLVKLVLGRVGAHVDTAENGFEAAEMALREPYDIIFLDMQMPVMDGYTAVRVLRNAGYEHPVIALTAHVMEGDREECEEAGCSGFLPKPISTDSLFSIVTRIVGDKAVFLDQDEQPAAAGAAQSIEPPESPALGAAVEVGAAVDAEDVAADDAGGVAEPIFPSLPMDDADFREIAEEFIDRCAEKLEEMQQASQSHAFDEVAKLAHWLKGAGGTAGFHVFTEPSAELEQAAKSCHAERVAGLVNQLRHYAARLTVEQMA